MKLIWKHKRTTFFTDKRTNIRYEIITCQLKYEPYYIFEKRHNLKVKIKKYWLSKTIK
jgi:hypothetical protein